MQFDQLKRRAFIALLAARRRGHSRRAQQGWRIKRLGVSGHDGAD
jgi:hypothetical protein